MNTAIVFISEGAALCMVVFGIHQLINPNAWTHYLPKFIVDHSPISSELEMRIHAIGNVFLGLLLASQLAPWWAALLALIWWITIIPFAFRVRWDIGMRDLTVAFALAGLLVLVSL